MADNERQARQAQQPSVPDSKLEPLPGPLPGPDAAAGPLVVREANRRYFTVACGDVSDRKVVYLTGSHMMIQMKLRGEQSCSRKFSSQQRWQLRSIQRRHSLKPSRLRAAMRL
jgi:hypothetical protein